MMHGGEPAPPIVLRELARPLAAVAALFLALMLAWSVVVPTFRGADEHVHHDFLRHLTETWDYPDYDELAVHQRTLQALNDSPVYEKDDPPAPADAATARRERSSWTDLGPDVRSPTPNQLAQHPPLYYVPTAAVLRIIDGDGDAPLDRVVWQLRVLNVLTLAPLPLLAADIARRFTTSRTTVLAAAAMVLAIPQLAHEGSTLSNDPIMVLLGGVTLAGVARMLTGDHRWRTAAWTGVAAGLALLTKGFAVPLVPAVALACLLPLATTRKRDGSTPTEHADGDSRAAVSARCTLVAGLALAFGGWWWIRNVVVHGNPQPGLRLRPRVEDVEIDLVRFAGSFGERLIGSFWGDIGWREAHLPLGLSVVLTIGLIVTVVAAVWGQWRRLVLVVPVVVAGAMVLSAGWGAYKKTGVSHATQGRYLFVAVAALAALAAIGLARIGGPWVRRHLAVVVLGVAVALQLLTLAIAVRRYWGGDGLGRLRALVEFSPLPGPVTTGLLVLPWLAAAVAIAEVGTRRTASATGAP